MKRYFSKILTFVPPLLLFGDFVSHFTEMTVTKYIVFGNVFGTSLMTGIVFIWVYWLSNQRYCWFTKFCVVALILINILCLLGNLVNYETYKSAYSIIITAIVFFLTAILALKKI